METLRADLENLNQELSIWNSRVESEYRSIQAENQISPDDITGLRDAVMLAVSRAGPSPASRVLDNVCRVYLSAPSNERQTIRKAVESNRQVLTALRDYMGRCAKLLRSTGDSKWLELGLAAASIQDKKDDLRDTLIVLGSLYLAATNAGLDPLPYFHQVADISNSEDSQGGGSTRNMLANFERSAYFVASVKSKLSDSG